MFPVDVRSLPQNRTRPLTAEEIAQRREALKQRLAEKKEHSSQDNVSATGELSNAVDVKPLPDEETTVTEDNQQVFVAFARVFSGVVRRGQMLYVLGPKHDPCKVLDSKSSVLDAQNCAAGDLEHICTVQLNDVYMFMGRELEALDEIPAGNILGIGGLEDYVLKSAALSSTIACPAFTDMHQEATPIVCVAIEPRSMSDMDALIHGMKLLNQSDPCVEVLIQESGEHVIVAAGEVHLQKCLDDLRLRFSRIDIDMSAPIVPFRETVVPPPTTDRVNELIESDVSRQQVDSSHQPIKTVVMTTANQQCVVHIRAVPLPSSVVRSLVHHTRLIKTANKLSSAVTSADKSDVLCTVSEQVATELQQFRLKLETEFTATEDNVWSNAVDRIWSFSRNGTNILLNGVEGYERPTLWSALDGPSQNAGTLREYDSAVVSGFHIATQSGPLCEEPMMGVCFVIEKWLISDTSQPTESLVAAGDDLMASDSVAETLSDGAEAAGDDDDEDTLPSSMQRADIGMRCQLSGQLISCVKEGCRKAFQAHPQRLMWPMYTCVIQATTDVLGKMYAVIGRRSGRIINDELREGSSIFNVTAVLPVVESFGFADEIRKRTSGLASPQLHFSHWEVIDIDPFWVPTTEEEYLHFGEKADSENVARKHMNSVRRRKGLHVDEKIVEFAEKQRTLKKNK